MGKPSRQGLILSYADFPIFTEVKQIDGGSFVLNVSRLAAVRSAK